MARIHRGRRGFEGAQRRKLTWATVRAAPQTITTTGTLVDLLSEYKLAGGSTQGITIMRTHIALNVTAATAGVGDGAFVGLVVGTDVDTATQVTPTEPFLDWMLYTSVYAAGGGGVINSHMIDIRAKRKMQELNQIYWLNLVALLGVNATQVAFTARTLIALP